MVSLILIVLLASTWVCTLNSSCGPLLLYCYSALSMSLLKVLYKKSHALLLPQCIIISIITYTIIDAQQLLINNIHLVYYRCTAVN